MLNILIMSAVIILQPPVMDGQTPVHYTVALMQTGPYMPVEIENGIIDTSVLDPDGEYQILIQGTYVNETGETLYPCPYDEPSPNEYLQNAILNLRKATGTTP